ncbi:hypothetical protein EXM22_02010 [Oceanispirochaeta crateris]|uniref:MAE-28990/MAE-18760-like HEPN domain-containing protein n=1 Tax=Oceanispirochaeta crateris TaxID=2518645 RepID=A0A5C1QFK2_9SPIO|nr:MAE_28990/MAE_18760 family HEPN-like nuclease [Oceanispirochaeta crateris]QEN06825.1 hypothetical protein EXM22_02010 [Oceanispirochaeta crateris]
MIDPIEKFEDSLVKDLAWRKKELQILKMAIIDTENIIYIKSYLLLLYSHWEGFVKKSALSYLNFINSRKIKLHKLNDNFLYLKIKKDINDCSLSLNNPSIGNELKLIRKIDKAKNEIFKIKISNNDKLKFIDTESNLSSSVFEKILNILGIEIPVDFSELIIDKTNSYRYKARIHLIDFLLQERNSIAHGDVILEDDINDILDRSVKIVELLDLFIITLVENIRVKNYLKSVS